MAKRKLPATSSFHKPGVYTGRHPDTGVLHRLTIKASGQLLIERKPYVSSGWLD
ncbi:hypothetical protein [Spirosoma fluminis]